MSAAALVAAPVPLRPEGLLAQSGLGLLHRDVPGHPAADLRRRLRRPDGRRPRRDQATTYYVPAIITLAVISATMQSLAMSLMIAREDGRLKRGRGTPMPRLGLHRRPGRQRDRRLAADAGAAGGDRRRPLRGRRSPGTACRRSLVTLAVGAASFCCLGIALTAAIPSQDAAAPIVNALLLPLYFLSGVFIPDDQLPNGVIHFADAFPIRHFFEAFFGVYVPAGAGGSESSGTTSRSSPSGASRRSQGCPAPPAAALALKKASKKCLIGKASAKWMTPLWVVAGINCG